MDLSNKTVLITGAGGFIGQHIVEIFTKHHWKVYALIHNNLPEKFLQNSNIEIIKGDILSENILSEIIKIIGKQPEIVVHAAGLASDVGNDEVYKKINFESVKTFSKLPAEKFIFISTTDVYGLKDFNGEDEETLTHENKPLSPYPKYKIKSEKWIKENIEKNKYVIIRPAAVWGEGDKTLLRRVVSFLKMSPFIVNFGKWQGKNRWPLADVKNIAKVVYTTAICNDFDGEAINIIDEKRTSVNEYYEQVGVEYFPEKTFKSITLPFWFGKVIGKISTILSNLLGRTTELFDPTFYSVHHVACNLDFSCQKQNDVLSKYEELSRRTA